MKTLIFALVFLLAAAMPSYAVYLINCDSDPHAILVLENGNENHITLTSRDSYSNYSPVVSFQVQGISPIMLARPEDKFSIWKDNLRTKIMCSSKNKPKVINGILVR